MAENENQLKINPSLMEVLVHVAVACKRLNSAEVTASTLAEDCPDEKLKGLLNQMLAATEKAHVRFHEYMEENHPEINLLKVDGELAKRLKSELGGMDTGSKVIDALLIKLGMKKDVPKSEQV